MKRGDAAEVYSNKKRFAFTDEDVASITMLKPPTTTTHATQWALRNFQDWMQSRNTMSPSCTVPLDILDSPDTESLNKWLSYYIIETCNCKGENYSETPLYGHSWITDTFDLRTAVIRRNTILTLAVQNSPWIVDPLKYGIRTLSRDAIYFGLTKLTPQ